MSSVIERITTKDVIAVLVVGAVLVFNGYAMVSGHALDAGTVGMAGVIVGHYFGPKVDTSVATRVTETVLAEPAIGDGD